MNYKSMNKIIKAIEDGKKMIKVGPPPIHTHYDEEKQMDILCGRVICPEGFVGIEIIGNIYSNPELLK